MEAMKQLNLLFVVHRAPPFPGGSEIYVGAMAKEAMRRGHNVAILAGEHKGRFENIPVTHDGNVLLQPWDLIIVHGADVNVQDYVLSNAKNIPSPILYLLVLPSNNPIPLRALQDCAYIGCSTTQDWEHCKANNVLHKAVQVSHGIEIDNCLGIKGFKEKHNINQRMFVSCGGYWPNKAMIELAGVFEGIELKDSILVTTGYDNRMDLMPRKSDRVIPLLINDRQEVLSAIKDADCMIMHSYQEGFGLVLLESMLNRTPWIARDIAGANLLKQHGKTYTTDQELTDMLQNFDSLSFDLDSAYNHVLQNHLISNTITDIENIIK